MRHSPTARKVWWLTLAFTTTAAAALLTTGLFPKHTRAASTLAFFLDDASLTRLPPESSIFLLADLIFPDDGRQSLIRRNGELHRLDRFQDGRRAARAEIDPRRPYCAILSRLSTGVFVERVKRLQISEVSRLSQAEGVRIRVNSFQDSAIEELRCYSGTGRSSPAPLTVGSLRAALGPVDGDLVLLAPPGQPAQMFAQGGREERYPAGLHYHEALTERPGATTALKKKTTEIEEPTLRNLRDAHRAYLRYLESLKPLNESNEP